MSPDDFIRNNRGIDDGKDLPEEYMRSLYGRIIKHEIKMKGDDFTPQQKQSTSNRILGLDNILNIVVRRRDSPAETSDEFIKHMQEQFKEKARKSEYVNEYRNKSYLLDGNMDQMFRQERSSLYCSVP